MWYDILSSRNDQNTDIYSGDRLLCRYLLDKITIERRWWYVPGNSVGLDNYSDIAPAGVKSIFESKKGGSWYSPWSLKSDIYEF